MPTIGMGVDISTLVDATISGDMDQMIAAGRRLLQRGAPAAELLGRVGMIAAHGDRDGHPILTLNAAAALSRYFVAIPPAPGQDPQSHEQELPLLVQALIATAPAVKAGHAAQDTYPAPRFPSELGEGHTVDEALHTAIYGNDETTVERLLFGLYGTGADYRTMEVRTYDGISTAFQNAGHPLLFAVRGFQLLDAVEWGDRAPNILHWLAPHLPLYSDEPDWIHAVRTFNDAPAHSLASLRTRLAFPREENALALRDIILSGADTTQVCQGVYDALMSGGASSQGVGSVIALAAAEMMQKVGDENRDAFIEASHGLLFAAATRHVYSQVQDIAALPLLFTAASYINALQKVLEQPSTTPTMPTIPATPLGGGLIAPALLETLNEQILAQELKGALSTARRYLRMDNDTRALFAIIGRNAAQADAAAEQGHTLQIVQAAAEAYSSWPTSLGSTNIDAFLDVALRAAAYAPRNTLVRTL